MKTKKVPMRKCVGCMVSKPKKELIRLTAEEGGGLKVDSTGKANGRGVYLCPCSQCFALARKRKAIGRSLGVSFSEETLDNVFEELRQHEKKD